MPATDKLWVLLHNLYGTHSTLSDFPDDMRKPSAARLVVAAWKARESHRPQSGSPKPAFVSNLEAQLAVKEPKSEVRTGMSQGFLPLYANSSRKYKFVITSAFQDNREHVALRLLNLFLIDANTSDF